MYIAQLIIYDKRNLTTITENADTLKTMLFLMFWRTENEIDGHTLEMF